MGRKIELNDLSTLLESTGFPLDRRSAVDEFSEVTLVLADGEANLGELVAEMTSETFESGADLESELHNVLPREAVGEPFQSEGDA